MFGKDVITPNMHMHCHLRACILDYGPLHGFWLYSFEWYNGAMPNNNRSIEVQIMRRFLSESQAKTVALPLDFRRTLDVLGSILDTVDQQTSGTSTLTLSLPNMQVYLPKHCSRQVMDSTEIEFLTKLYSKLYAVPSSALDVPNCYLKYSSALINGWRLGSHKSRSASSCIVMVTWDNDVFGPTQSTESDIERSTDITRAVRINHFCKHSININGQNNTASLSWYKYHPSNSTLGKPITVWYSDLFESFGTQSLVPVHMIKCRSVSLISKLEGESAIFVCPCINY